MHGNWIHFTRQSRTGILHHDQHFSRAVRPAQVSFLITNIFPYHLDRHRCPAWFNKHVLYYLSNDCPQEASCFSGRSSHVPVNYKCNNWCLEETQAPTGKPGVWNRALKYSVQSHCLSCINIAGHSWHPRQCNAFLGGQSAFSSCLVISNLRLRELFRRLSISRIDQHSKNTFTFTFFFIAYALYTNCIRAAHELHMSCIRTAHASLLDIWCSIVLGIAAEVQFGTVRGAAECSLMKPSAA